MNTDRHVQQLLPGILLLDSPIPIMIMLLWTTISQFILLFLAIQDNVLVTISIISVLQQSLILFLDISMCFNNSSV